MKILLTGSSGLLGSEFKRCLEGSSNVQLLAPSHAELELLEADKVLSCLEKHQPDLIIHCVAYTQVDQAETSQEDCWAINVGILENILKAEIPIIHFSTDYVFDAPDAAPLTEDAVRNPINYYAESKVEAEKLLENSGIKWWNIRTSWLFGKAKTNFIDKILKKAKTHQRIQVVDDQVGRPTYVKDLAEYIVEHFIRPPLAKGGTGGLASGHYHLQGLGRAISWADLAEFVINAKGLNCEVERVESKTYNSPARRPAFSVLGNTKLPEDLRDWEDAVRHYLS